MIKKNSNNLIFGILTLALFFLIAYLSTGTLGVSMDERGLSWANSGLTDAFLWSMQWISDSAAVFIVGGTIILTILYIRKKKWENLILYYFVVVGGVVFNTVLKFIFQRPRPEGEEKIYDILGFQIESFSYPSGHTMRTTIFVLFLVYLILKNLKKGSAKRIALVLCFVYIIVMGVSRVALKAHYITDIIGAVVASIAWIFLSVYVYKLIQSKWDLNTFKKKV